MKQTLRIEILGAGCKKCQQLEANARQTVAMRNLTAGGSADHRHDANRVLRGDGHAGPGRQRRGSEPRQSDNARGDRSAFGLNRLDREWRTFGKRTPCRPDKPRR
jgi:hypothetical protein